MLGGTHLAFGTATSLAAVGLIHVGLGPGVVLHHVTLPLYGSRHIALAIPDMHPTAWLALPLGGGLGSVLPDIDQPGSLVTRLPARQTRALQQRARPYSRGAIGTPARLTVNTLAAGGGMASALLGDGSGRGSAAGRMLLFVLAAVLTALAVLARWLPPEPLLAWPVQARHTLALCLGTLALAGFLLAAGGIAGLVHRLPGHHRGWTHAPPVALALTAAAFSFGPLLLPALPGVGPAFAVGYISHLVADALTIRGIPLWWPGQHRPSLHLLPRPVRVQTGGKGEALFNVWWPCALIAALIATGMSR